MGPDSFEVALQEELVKLHRRLVVEHRKYSATLHTKGHDKRNSHISNLSEGHSGLQEGGGPQARGISPEADRSSPAALPEPPEEELQPPEQGNHSVVSVTSGAEEVVSEVIHTEEAKSSAEAEAKDESSEAADAGKLGDDTVERLESVNDSNSEPDAPAESEGDAKYDSEQQGKQTGGGSVIQFRNEPSYREADPPGLLPVMPVVSEKVKNCPVAAAAAATAMARSSKASSESPRVGRRKLSTFRGNDRSASFHQSPEHVRFTGDNEQAQADGHPVRGRWRRKSIGNFEAAAGKADDRKPPLANLTDQLAETLRSDMRRPSISSLRSSDRHSVGSPRMSHGFDVLPVWKRSVLANARTRMTSVGVTTLVRRNSTIAALLTENEEEGGAGSVEADRSLLRHWIMSPSSLPRLCWDFLAMVLMFYDCLVIPMMVFDMELGFFQGMVWITRIFWTINVPVSALTGFLRKDGTVEMRGNQVFRAYLRSWCMPDMLIITIDWAEVIVNFGSGGWSRFGNALRFMRIARVVRIVRFIKAPEVMDFFNEYIRSEEVMLIVSLSKVILLTLSVAHIIACLWYGVGSISSSDDRRWIKMFHTDELNFGQQYLVSFHWSLAQFAGELIIEPQNDSERAFTVVVLFLAIIGSSMFVSSLTTSMTRLQILSSKQSSQLATLRRFLLDRNISRPLATRVQQNAQYALMEQKKDIPEASVDLLSMISNPLLVELHYEIYSHTLLEHPFFQCYNHINPGGVQKVCNQCVRLFTMYKGDLLFSDFEVPSSKRMYIMVNGSLTYSQPRRLQVLATKGMWMCEAFLWTHWSHCGTARAHQTSRLLALDAEKFQSIIATFPTPHARHYAELFVDSMNEYEVDELTDLETLIDELDDLIEEAFPVEDDGDAVSDEGGGSQEDGASVSSNGTGSHSVAWDTRLSARSASKRDKKSQRTTGGDRRVSGSMKHERANLVAKKLGKLTRKGSMTEKSMRNGWNDVTFRGICSWFDLRCSCCTRDYWRSSVRDAWRRLASIRVSRATDTGRSSSVRPMVAVPSG